MLSCWNSQPDSFQRCSVPQVLNSVPVRPIKAPPDGLWMESALIAVCTEMEQKEERGKTSGGDARRERDREREGRGERWGRATAEARLCRWGPITQIPSFLLDPSSFPGTMSPPICRTRYCICLFPPLMWFKASKLLCLEFHNLKNDFF